MTYLTRSRNEKLISVLYDRQGLMIMPTGATVAAGSRAIRQGDFLARNTNTDKLIVAKNTLVNGASSSRNVTVDDAHPFEIGDAVDIGGDDRNIVGINYDTNVITVNSDVTVANNDPVKCETNNQDEAFGVALLPLMDKEAANGGMANMVTPKMGDHLYGDVAIAGRFKVDQLIGFANGNYYDTDMSGRFIDYMNNGNGVYIVTTPSVNMEL